MRGIDVTEEMFYLRQMKDTGTEEYIFQELKMLMPVYFSKHFMFYQETVLVSYLLLKEV